MVLDVQNPWGSYPLNSWQNLCRDIAQKMPSKKLVNLIRQIGGLRSVQIADVEVFGQKFRLYPGNNISDKRLLGMPHLFDRKEREFLASYLKQRPESVFLDVGANVGAYSGFIKSLGLGNKIVSIEASPETFKKLSFNLPSADVVKFNCAVAEEEGKVNLQINQQNAGENKIAAAGEESVKVEAKRLSDIIKQNCQSAPVMKIDIEGYEENVLAEMFKNCEKEMWPKLIIAEHLHAGGLENLLMQNGYIVELKAKMNSVFMLK